MDFLNKAFAQLAELFHSMTPGARITAGLLLVVAVVSLGYLFTYQVAGPDCYLMNGRSFSPSEQRDLEAAFGAENLNTYEFAGTQIRVPRGQRTDFMAAALKHSALPEDPGAKLEGAVNGQSMFEGSETKKQRIKNAIQEELATSIKSMPGIAYAAVIYTSQATRGFNKSSLTKASVRVKPQGTKHLEPVTASVIRKMVAGAVTDLKYENVTLTDLNAGRAYVGGPDDGGEAGDDPHLAKTHLREERLKAKILESLAYVPGIIVEPNVELDTERMSRTETTKYDPKATAYLVEEKITSRISEGSTPGGEPGLPAQGAVSNGPSAVAARTTAGTKETEDDSDRTEYSKLAGSRVLSEDGGHKLKSVSVVVTVPNSYFEKVWHQQNPVAEGEEAKTPEKTDLAQIAQTEMAKIRTTVAGFLPSIDGVADNTQLVTVTPFQDFQPEEIPAPGMGTVILTWLSQYWGTLGILGLAAFSLVMLRSMVRAIPTGPTADGAPAVLSLHTGGKEEEPSKSPDPVNRLMRFSGHGPSLRDELGELVKEDPDAAANILKTWISNAG